MRIVDLSPYERNFKTISGKQINFYQNYNATEGFLDYNQKIIQTICFLCWTMEFIMSS